LGFGFHSTLSACDTCFPDANTELSDSMNYEVELKFSLTDADQRRIIAELSQLGAERRSQIEQRDLYFNHPQRDFAKTDEALRIRVVDESAFITYKGPLLDSQTKSRHEIELPVGQSPADGDQLSELLELLGFCKVRTVAKTRVPWHLHWEDRPAEVVLDDVQGLGQFLELEILADPSTLDETRASILRLAEHLGLKHSERRSYLRLLLDIDAKKKKDLKLCCSQKKE